MASSFRKSNGNGYMKIKVIKSNQDTYWYANRIGEVFEVYENRDCYTTDHTHYFDKDDCEIISDVSDPVNSPSHYTDGGIETIDYLKAKLTQDEFAGYLRGNILKYVSRAGKKDDVAQDLKKAQWYLNKLITITP
jgi:hypothetical protein